MKSLIVSIFSLFAITLFIIVVFLYVGQTDLDMERRAMKGDRKTSVVLASINRDSNQDRPNYVAPDPDTYTDEPEIDFENAINTVVWINIPGFRGDYIEKAEAKFMETMINDGSSTEQLQPNFPSLTFPAHVTMATGTTPDQHGIPSDRFRANGSLVNKPLESSLIESEPIWETATRQGIPTLVHDWPLSQNQTSANKALYSLSSFDASTNDQQRLDRLWDAWIAHKGEKKLGLLMCRLDDILNAGQANGPLSDDTYEAVKKTDKSLESFITKVQAAWPNLRTGDNGNLVVLITTDHGLSELDRNVNLNLLLGDELTQHLDIAAHDAVAHLYFKNLPESEAEANLEKEKIEAELKKKTYFKTYNSENLPSSWKYTSSSGRIGDRVLILKDGFAFSDYEADEPVFNPSEGPSLYGGFGFPVEEAFRMSGQTIIWGSPNQIGYGSLGEIDQTVFHASVCKLLKIEPSDKANKKTLNF